MSLFNKNKQNIIDLENVEVDTSEILHKTFDKTKRLLQMFNEIGVRHPIGHVLEETGFKNQAVIKTLLTRIRKKGVDIRIKWGFMERKV